MKISLDVYAKAHRHVRTYLSENNPLDPLLGGYNLWTWIGEFILADLQHQPIFGLAWDVPDDKGRIIQLLASPHYHAILKAAEATNQDWYHRLIVQYERRSRPKVTY